MNVEKTHHATTFQGILFDYARGSRAGLPEAVFCEGKSDAAWHTLLQDYGTEVQNPVLCSQLALSVSYAMPEEIQARYDCHELSRTAFCARMPRKEGNGVAVVSAGTADGNVTREAARTLEYFGIENRMYEDCGAAGSWRLLDHLKAVNRADIIIAVAGLDAELVSVLGGLTVRPLFAVPVTDRIRSCASRRSCS